MTSNFTQMTNTPDLFQALKASQNNLSNSLNCVRIGIIQKFYEENLTAEVLIANKKLLGLNRDGSQILQDYPPIYAKVCYCNPFQTFPLTQGMECILLFADREIESWFINGGVNPLSYTRVHDKTDAIAIVGIRSLPNMINILTDCLHLFYGNSSLQLKNTETDINSNTINLSANTININGNLVINGKPYTAHTHSNGNEGNPTGGVIE
jgi:hypothetical protein|nr:MAG TPA: baseplate protein [Caudoviricetes sp.]